MTLDEAQQTLINAWGTLGSQWGVSRSMAQVHALLMVSPGPLTTEDVMNELQISRGNAHTCLQDLMGWGIVEKALIRGERKEFYVAEKDIWKVAMQVAKERKRRELEPILKVLDQVSTVEGDPQEPNLKQFNETIAGLKHFAANADRYLDTMIRADESWFWGSLLKAFRR